MSPTIVHSMHTTLLPSKVDRGVDLTFERAEVGFVINLIRSFLVVQKLDNFKLISIF